MIREIPDDLPKRQELQAHKDLDFLRVDDAAIGSLKEEKVFITSVDGVDSDRKVITHYS